MTFTTRFLAALSTAALLGAAAPAFAQTSTTAPTEAPAAPMASPRRSVRSGEHDGPVHPGRQRPGRLVFDGTRQEDHQAPQEDHDAPQEGRVERSSSAVICVSVRLRVNRGVWGRQQPASDAPDRMRDR